MSISGYPTDPGDRGRQDDGRATPAGEPPTDWDAQFTAIVSGISGTMHWETVEDTDRKAEDGDGARRRSGGADTADRDTAYRNTDFERAPDSIWTTVTPDTADDRRLRREMRRAERADALAAFQQAQAEIQAAHEADTEHFVPPPPPPLPRFRRRTVGALVLMFVGVVLLVFPALLPASFELIAVLGLLLLLGGAAILVAGMRHHRSDPDDGDDGAQV